MARSLLYSTLGQHNCDFGLNQYIGLMEGIWTANYLRNKKSNERKEENVNDRAWYSFD